MTTTIRVSERTRERISALAESSSRPMASIVEEAIDALERRRFFASFNDGYEKLREDSGAWREVEAERRLESAALADTTS